MEWNEGYVVDVPYVEQVYREMTPPWLSLTTVLSAQPPLDTTRPFTYLELGCGRGLTANTIAATCPTATVWACDFNPAHVERARHVASTAGLSNSTFEEAAFDELAGDPSLGPRQADVIALHGIYSWVSPANRRHVVDIIRRRLVPGGLVYISYDVLTGWAAMMPVQHTLRVHVGTDRRRSDVAIRSAVATIMQLAEDGAAAFPLAPPEQSTFDSIAERDPGYVAHEYLGGSAPLMFADVAAELSAAKCLHVGNTSLATVLPDLRVPRELVPILRSTPDVAMRETICDLVGQTMFRADVFRRGLALVTAPGHRRDLDDLQLLSSGLEFDAAMTVSTGGGPVRLDQEQYAPLIARLAEGPATVGQLRDLSPLRDRSDHDVRTLVTLLVVAGYALRTSPDWQRNNSIESCWRLNRALIEDARQGDYRGVLVSPATGQVISVPPLVALAIGEHWDGVPLDAQSLTDAVAARVGIQQLPLAADAARAEVGNGSAAVADGVRQAMGLLAEPLRTLGIHSPETVRRRPQGGRGRRG